MTFEVRPDAYDRFMGRYSSVLAPQLADFAEIHEGQRVLDVGCGPGALTGELVRRLGPRAVTSIDPSESFVSAARERYPGVSVHRGTAEDLPFEDDAFDGALAQLVVHFMTDPVRGLGEMGRVTRSGGVVAACVWDHAGGSGPLGVFWRAAHEVDPVVRDESHLAGTRKGHLVELLGQAGLDQIREGTLTSSVRYDTFDEWWEPFTGGVGPAGAYTMALTPSRRERLRQRCLEMLPDAPFDVTALAWAARGVVR
jgi:SAM-dependent methyltransferase